MAPSYPYRTRRTIKPAQMDGREVTREVLLRAGPLQAPVVIAVAALTESGGRITALDELCATACAVQNLLLSAHQRGLGSFWSTAPVSCSREFTSWLGLDSGYLSLGLVYLGHAAAGTAARSSRVPLEERVTFHGD